MRLFLPVIGMACSVQLKFDELRSCMFLPQYGRCPSCSILNKSIGDKTKYFKFHIHEVVAKRTWIAVVAARGTLAASVWVTFVGFMLQTDYTSKIQHTTRQRVTTTCRIQTIIREQTEEWQPTSQPNKKLKSELKIRWSSIRQAGWNILLDLQRNIRRWSQFSSPCILQRLHRRFSAWKRWPRHESPFHWNRSPW